MKVAIFDMDGTLVDSAKDLTISINEVRRVRHGLDELSEKFVVEAINRDKRNLAQLFYNTLEYEEEDKIYFEKHYNEQCVKNISLYSGIKETLHALKDNNVNISVATNAPTKFAYRMLQECEIFDFFDFVVGADMVKKAKPDKEMIEYILNGYPFSSYEKALMIGDNSKDMRAAKHAGIDSVFATWGFSPKSDYHKIVTHPKQIINLF